MYKTPSEFYRERRPEYFSDSEKNYEVKLTKEIFAYELHQISINQKQDAFEALARRLAEKFIAPNLIPQVGPTGGGDGKTDADTYPVSELISERWFVPNMGWERSENWAFAISAKAAWKGKLDGDVTKIINTGRGYTKIFFITNQLVASKKKKDAQDELSKKYGIDIVILDGEWITEKIYNNDLISLAVDSLNLSAVYKNERTIVGKNDAGRNKRLEEIESHIADTNRYSDFDYQLIEDALEAAILTRMLEKSKDEVIGKFDRSLRLATKINNLQQLARIHYQRAWTFANWYDDYGNFFSDFEQFRILIKQEPTINGLELYFNLLNISRVILTGKDIQEQFGIGYDQMENEYTDILKQCSTNVLKKATSLVASTYKSFLCLARLLHNEEDAGAELDFLKTCFQQGRNYLEYPFESFKNMVEIYGSLLPDSKSYDSLVDCMAEISEARVSELSSGETFLKRGAQKLEKGFYKESLIYFGKSVRKLAKEETQNGFYLALRGLNEAYRKLGLLWAAQSSITAAASIMVKVWYNEGRLTKKFYSCVKEALKNELFIGRIPLILGWFELFNAIAPQFEDVPEDDPAVTMAALVDGCLSVRLLNDSYEFWKSLTFLPGILEKQALYLSQDTALYLLGYTEEAGASIKSVLSDGRSIDDHYNMMANQPFKDQMQYGTNLVDEPNIEFRSIILGSEILVQFENDRELFFAAEILLAFLESFFATSFWEIIPSTEKISIRIISSVSVSNWCLHEKINHYDLELNLNTSANIEGYNDAFQKLTYTILTKNFVIRDPERYLKELFDHDEVYERQVFLMQHRKFSTGIFGEESKIFLNSWKSADLPAYPFKRSDNPITIEPVSITGLPSNPSRHNETGVSSIIDIYLWDNAGWKGFGFFNSQEVPFGIFIAFQNIDYGKQIFGGWINRFGRYDENEDIRISIIKGVNKEYPNWYRIHIAKRFELEEGKLITSTSRFHEMNTATSKNIECLMDRYNYFKQYVLVPAEFKSDGTIVPYADFGILKKHVVIKNAWEIGEHDLDSVVIREDDDPVIPTDKEDAPVIGLIKRKKEKNN